MRHYNKTRGKPKRKIRHITRKIRKGKKTRKFLIKKKGLRKIIRKLTKKILQRGGKKPNDALQEHHAEALLRFIKEAQENPNMTRKVDGKLIFTDDAEQLLIKISNEQQAQKHQNRQNNRETTETDVTGLDDVGNWFGAVAGETDNDAADDAAATDATDDDDGPPVVQGTVVRGPTETPADNPFSVASAWPKKAPNPPAAEQPDGPETPRAREIKEQLRAQQASLDDLDEEYKELDDPSNPNAPSNPMHIRKEGGATRRSRRSRRRPRRKKHSSVGFRK